MKRYGYHRTSTREQHLDRGIKEINSNMSEVTDSNYKMHGKVVQICKDSGEISLLRNTVFSRHQLDKMKEFQDVFNDPVLGQIVGEGGITTSVQDPVIMIIPIAIYI